MMRSKRKGCSFLKLDGSRREGKREAAIEPWRIQMKAIALVFVATVILLGLCSVLIASAIIPQRGMDSCVLGCCVTGVFLGGSYAVRRGGKRGALRGIGVGAGVAIILGVSGILLYSSLEIPWCIGMIFACILSGAISGVTYAGRRKRRRP